MPARQCLDVTGREEGCECEERTFLGVHFHTEFPEINMRNLLVQQKT